MSFHPNEIARRARIASWALVGIFVLLLSAFFKTQVVNYAKYSQQSETNRLREVPLPAPRGIIYDRNNQVIAENVPGYTVSMLGVERRLAARGAAAARRRSSRSRTSRSISPLRRYLRARNRPTAILSDALVRRRLRARGAAHRFPGADHPVCARSATIRTAPRSPRSWATSARSRKPSSRCRNIRATRPASRWGRTASSGSTRRGCAGARAFATWRSTRAGAWCAKRARARRCRRRPPTPLYTNIDLRPAALHREHLRRLAAGRRDRDRPEDGRRARAVFGAELRSQSLRRRHSDGAVEGCSTPIRASRSTTRSFRASIRRAPRGSSRRPPSRSSAAS